MPPPDSVTEAAVSAPGGKGAEERLSFYTSIIPKAGCVRGYFIKIFLSVLLRIDPRPSNRFLLSVLPVLMQLLCCRFSGPRGPQAADRPWIAAYSYIIPVGGYSIGYTSGQIRRAKQVVSRAVFIVLLRLILQDNSVSCQEVPEVFVWRLTFLFPLG